MKGLRKRFRRGLAGFLAFVLTMTSFNMVSWADVASAFDKENATFIMNGERSSGFRAGGHRRWQ